MTLNSIVANFQTFKLVDLLDILIIAFLIYQLLGFVNRTRAGQLAKGALIVMAVYLVANILNMRTVTWLLNSLLQVGLLTRWCRAFRCGTPCPSCCGSMRKGDAHERTADRRPAGGHCPPPPAAQYHRLYSGAVHRLL